MHSCKDFVVQNILSCPLKKHNFIKALKHNYYHIFLVKVYFGKLLIGWVTNVGSNLGGKIEIFSYLILFTHVVIWVSAAQNWKETFNSDIWK